MRLFCGQQRAPYDSYFSAKYGGNQLNILETSQYARSIHNLPVDWSKINDEELTFALGHLFIVNFFDFCNLFGEHKEGCLIAADLIKSQYDISLHLLIKKDWLSKHRVPYPRARQKLYKPKAEVFSQLFKLIERCLTWKKKVDLPGYQLTITDTPTWFSIVLFEWIKRDIAGSVLNLDSSESLSRPNSYRGRKKQTAMSQDRAFITMLERLDTSFLNYPFLGEATQEIYCTAIEMSERFDQFRKQYWKPYIKALRNELKHKSGKDWTVAHVELDKFKAQQGTGRGELSFTLEDWLKKYK